MERSQLELKDFETCEIKSIHLGFLDVGNYFRCCQDEDQKIYKIIEKSSNQFILCISHDDPADYLFSPDEIVIKLISLPDSLVFKDITNV